MKDYFLHTCFLFVFNVGCVFYGVFFSTSEMRDLLIISNAFSAGAFGTMSAQKLFWMILDKRAEKK